MCRRSNGNIQIGPLPLGSLIHDLSSPPRIEYPKASAINRLAHSIPVSLSICPHPPSTITITYYF